MKEIVLHDRGIVPILVDLHHFFVVRVVFRFPGTKSIYYYVCRYIKSDTHHKPWRFVEYREPDDGCYITKAKTIQEACQQMMNARSSEYTLSLWDFDSKEEFEQAVQSGVF